MDKHFKKKARIDGLLEMSPDDERFRALVLSNEQVFPPTREAEEEADALKRVAFASYDDATTPEEFSAAQVQNEASLAKLKLVEEQQGVFDEVTWCFDAAVMAENMELRAKTPNMRKAGKWKIARLHAKERLSEYEQHEAEVASEAAAEKKRKRSSNANTTAAVSLDPSQPRLQCISV